MREQLSNKRVAQNAAWLISGRFIELALSFIVTTWMIRYLGKESFGRLSFATSVAGLLLPVAGLGFENIAVRELAAGRVTARQLISSAMRWQLVAGVFALVVAIAVVGFDSEELALVAIAGISLPLLSLNAPTYVFRARLDGRVLFVARLSAVVIVVGLRICMIAFGASVAYFVGLLPVYSAAMATTLWTAWLRSPYRRVESSKPLDSPIGLQMLRDSWPLIISGLSVAVYMKLDQVMLRELMDASTVGVYGSAVRLSEVLYFIPTAIASSVLPLLSQRHASGTTESYTRAVQTVYDLMAAISYFVIIVGVLGAVIAIGLLYGEEYDGAAPILRVHLLSFAFVSLGVARGQWLVVENLTRFSMVSTGIGALLNILLNFLLIPPFGGVGAAWATLLSYGVSAYASALLTKRTRVAFVQISLALALPLRLRTVAPQLLKLTRSISNDRRH